MSIDLSKVAVAAKKVDVKEVVNGLRSINGFVLINARLRRFEVDGTIPINGNKVKILFNSGKEVLIKEVYKIKLSSDRNDDQFARVFFDHESFSEDISARNYLTRDIQCIAVGEENIKLLREAMASLHRLDIPEESLVHKIKIMEKFNNELSPVLNQLAVEVRRKKELIEMYNRLSKEIGSIKELEDELHNIVKILR